MNRAAFMVFVAGLLVVGIAGAGERPSEPKRDYRAAMRDFVQAISAQAKKDVPGFLVIPQGGVDLLSDKEKPANVYLKSIDGIGQEEIYYGFNNKDNRKTPKKETGFFLKQLSMAKAAGKPVLSIDYVRSRTW